MSIRHWMLCVLVALTTGACVGDTPSTATDAGPDVGTGNDAGGDAGPGAAVWDQAKWDEAKWQ